jgi:hypothetical protein
MNRMRGLMATVVLGAFVTAAQGAVAQPATPAGDASGLIGALTKETGVTPDQARGGAGALFAIAKGRMQPAEFAQVAKAVPDMDGLLKAAPASGGGTGSLGTMAAAAGAFQKLGLQPSMVGKFVPVLTSFVGSSGGADVAKLLTGALK